jgi:NitT/TauT family transport system ATP-binding protein
MAVIVANPARGMAGVESNRANEPAIVTSNLGRRFDSTLGSVDAIRNVSLTVARGEFVVIVGPSGCGKTTLLRLIAGLEQPTAGTLSLDGVGEDGPTNAMVFQGRSVFPWLSVRDNVAYGLKLNGVGRRERQRITDELLSVVGLSRFARSYPHQLSEGMRQRVALARALAVNPDLLLLDEPFGALDEQTRFILQEELLRIWETTRKTVVFVTHSIDEALTLADRVVVMTAQPGTIKAEVPIPFPRPRELASIRSDPNFARLFTQIWDLLRDEVHAARAAAGELR